MHSIRHIHGFRSILGVQLLLVLLLLAACGSRPPLIVKVTPSSSVTPTHTPTSLPTGAPTSTQMPTRQPSATPAPTLTPSPTLLPGAHLIAFETYRDGNGEIYLLDTDAGVLTNVTRHPADDRAPVWRPDGSAIAFQSHRDGNWELYILHLTDGSVQRLTEDPHYDGAPSWSPDGGQLAFESYRDGNLDIYLITLQNGEIRRLTSNAAGDYGPRWSPDGQSLAFTSWRDGNKEIYLAPVAEGELRNLTQNPADDEQPAWAPGGTALAFVSWRDANNLTGNRNAEIYRMDLTTGRTQRMTDNPWPDLDPSWDSQEQMLWAAYEPGPAFETYDPYRPGDYHLFRLDSKGLRRVTSGDWDDRHPAAAPLATNISLQNLLDQLTPVPPVPAPPPTLEPGTQARVIEVPSVLVGYSGQPVQLNQLVAPSLVAWQQDVLQASGWDFLSSTLGSWRNIDQVRKKDLYTYDYGYLSWHKAGRALDLSLEYKVDGVDQMLLTREDLSEQVYWRLYLRAAKQDGSMGEPLKENPWRFWWHIVPEDEPQAYDAGGKRLTIPAGYYVDVTALGKQHGWERIASYSIAGDYHWNTDSNGTEYWHYERTDGLVWWDAMRQIYPLDKLEQHVGWDESLRKAQSPDMMRSKGIPTPMP